MNRRSLSSLVAASLACATLISQASPSIALSPAQPPKPPTDAKKVAWQAKKGDHPFGPDQQDFVAGTKVKDFDLQVSIVNPALPHWAYGLAFRKLEENKGYGLIILSDGNVLMIIGRADKTDSLKPMAFSAALKKNAGETNDIAIYARNNQALVFINKAYVDTFDIGEYNDYGAVTLFGSGDKDNKSGTLSYKNFVVRTPASSPAQAYTPPTPGAAAAANIVISAYRFGIERYGRPQGMDTPKAGCNGFDDGRPVKSVQAALKIENKSSKPMAKWYAFFVKSDGKEAYTCFYTLPVVPPNDVRDVTFQAFVELNENVDYVIVVDAEVGQSNKLLVPRQ